MSMHSNESEKTPAFQIDMKSLVFSFIWKKVLIEYEYNLIEFKLMVREFNSRHSYPFNPRKCAAHTVESRN